MSAPEPPPARRVRVTSPRADGPRTRRVQPTSEIDARTRLGEIYVTSLLRAQLRLGLGVLIFVTVTLGGLPLLLTWVPELRETSVLGMPLPWVVLAGAVYPLLVGCGWFYVRRAERNERVFAALVEERPDDDGEPR